MPPNKNHYKERVQRRKEEKAEEPETPRYRDRAKERREDQNPDYEATELGFHAVAPPGSVDIRTAEAHKLSIEKSKYLGGDLEHTHLVKGLDFALLHKVRSEMDKKHDPAEDDGGKSRSTKGDKSVSFRTAVAKSVYQWIVKPQTVVKTNEMFLPGRMAVIFNRENGYGNDIPTTLHRSKADCPVPEEMVTVNVDQSVLDRITKIMSYLRLGSSGKVLKKKKKEVKGKVSATLNGLEEDEKPPKPNGLSTKNQLERERLPPPPPPPPPLRKDSLEPAVKPEQPVARGDEDDIFVGDGVDYEIHGKDMSQSPMSENMEESPRIKEGVPYFNGPVYGPVPPSDPSQAWQMNGYDAMQAQALAAGYQGEWQDYQYVDPVAYGDQYLQQSLPGYDMRIADQYPQDPRFMTQEEKDRGLGSVFKRDDQRLQQLREKDAREKDPNFISESYSECYPGYQEYNREVVDSDDEGDLSKMDMGGRAKGRLHRWDFETEEEWAKYNEQKEAMPKAAFQFGVKMQDGRKTRKQNREQKITNDLHKINKIIARKKTEKGGGGGGDADGGPAFDDPQPAKKLRV